MRFYKICGNCECLMKKTDEVDEYMCPICGSVYTKMGKKWIFLDSSIDTDDDGDYGGRPACCTGCGSDMWPDCQYSCKIMDN